MNIDRQALSKNLWMWAGLAAAVWGIWRISATAQEESEKLQILARQYLVSLDRGVLAMEDFNRQFSQANQTISSTQSSLSPLLSLLSR